MDNNIDNAAQEKGCCAYWYKMGHGRWFVVICVFVLIFVISSALAFRHERREWNGRNGLPMSFQELRGGRGLFMRNGSDLRKDSLFRKADDEKLGRGWGVMHKGCGLNYLSGTPDVASSTRIFGSLAKIEGNKLTLADNGGKEQVVMSQSDTVIMTPTGESTLTSRKPGMIINAVCEKASDGSLNATRIMAR